MYFIAGKLARVSESVLPPSGSRLRANEQLSLTLYVNLTFIDRIHKWRSRNYSFVLVLIILTSLTLEKKNSFEFCLCLRGYNS